MDIHYDAITLLHSAEVAEFFEPSVQAAVMSIKAQVDASQGMIKVGLLSTDHQHEALLISDLTVRLASGRIRGQPVAI